MTRRRNVQIAAANTALRIWSGSKQQNQHNCKLTKPVF